MAAWSNAMRRWFLACLDLRRRRRRRFVGSRAVEEPVGTDRGEDAGRVAADLLLTLVFMLNVG